MLFIRLRFLLISVFSVCPHLLSTAPYIGKRALIFTTTPHMLLVTGGYGLGPLLLLPPASEDTDSGDGVGFYGGEETCKKGFNPCLISKSS